MSKVTNVVNILFGAVVVSSMIGGVVKPGSELPIAALTLVTLSWVCARIVRDAILSSIAMAKGDSADPGNDDPAAK